MINTMVSTPSPGVDRFHLSVGQQLVQADSIVSEMPKPVEERVYKPKI